MENFNQKEVNDRELCSQAWAAYQLNNIPEANRLCNKLIDLIRRQNRKPNKREQDLINTLSEK